MNVNDNEAKETCTENRSKHFWQRIVRELDQALLRAVSLKCILSFATCVLLMQTKYLIVFLQEYISAYRVELTSSLDNKEIGCMS